MDENNLSASSDSSSQAADSIRARIESGELAGQLPAVRILAGELGVSYQTLRHVMARLREIGLVVIQEGRGSFVVLPPETGLPG